MVAADLKIEEIIALLSHCHELELHVTEFHGTTGYTLYGQSRATKYKCEWDEVEREGVTPEELLRRLKLRHVLLGDRIEQYRERFK